MKKYDIVIPLGDFCSTAVALRDCGIRKTSYPFDWSAGEFGNRGFLTKIQLICNEFQDAFNLEDLEEMWSSNKEHRSLRNKKTGLHYFHDFEWDKSVSEQYATFLEKYERRSSRLIDDIKQGTHILFIWATRLNIKLSINETKEALELLNNKFPNKDIDFLVLQDSVDCQSNETGYVKCDEHIHIYLYHDIAGEVFGNQTVTKRIFNQFIKGVDEYNFAIDNVKNYGLSFKENWGRWSDGNDVWLDVPVCFDGDVEIDFDIWPYLVEQHPTQDVDVLLNNKKIASWHFQFGASEQPKTSLNIPASKIKNKSVLLHFVIKNPVSLAELGLGENTRKLGIGFKKMKITAVDPEPDSH